MLAYELYYIFSCILIHCDDIKIVSLDSSVQKSSAGDTDSCQQLCGVNRSGCLLHG